MATQIISNAPNHTTDANFRLWGKMISDALAACGWTKTDDTGQIDWLTVTRPTTNNENKGYEIWYSNDAGDGLNDIYLKIEYGGGGTAANPGIWITFGFGSDGEGNLTGHISERQQIGTATSSATAYNSYFSGGDGWFICSMFGLGSSIPFNFGVERTRDANGDFQNEIIVLTRTASGNPPLKSQIVNQSSGAYTAENAPNACGTVNKTNAVAGGNIGLDILCGQKGGLGNPSQLVFGSTVALIGAFFTTVTVDSYGETHTYLLTDNYFLSGAGSYQMIRWE